jgi:hypothetical protein
MPDISTTTVVLKEQELNLVLRPETKNWQIHYKIGASKTWHRKQKKLQMMFITKRECLIVVA